MNRILTVAASITLFVSAIILYFASGTTGDISNDRVAYNSIPEGVLRIELSVSDGTMLDPEPIMQRLNNNFAQCREHGVYIFDCEKSTGPNEQALSEITEFCRLNNFNMYYEAAQSKAFDKNSHTVLWQVKSR